MVFGDGSPVPSRGNMENGVNAAVMEGIRGWVR